MIPGSDILEMALSVLGTQSVLWHKFISRETNDIGLDEAVYAIPRRVDGSWQPVPRRAYQQYGLDFNRNYATFYVSRNLQDITRDSAGDKLEFNNREWECLGATDWFAIDGWTAILCVEFLKKTGGYSCAG